MSKLKLHLKKGTPSSKIINPQEPRKQLSKAEKKIIERASTVFSACKIKDSDRKVFKLRQFAANGKRGEYVWCVVPYTEYELRNSRPASGVRAHLQWVRKDKIKSLLPCEYTTLTGIPLLQEMASL